MCELCADKSEDDPLYKSCKHCSESRQKIFKGDKCKEEFCDWLFSSKETDNSIALAHNLKAYDGYFLLSFLYDNAIIPDVIYTGCKIQSITLPKYKCKIVDSINFLPMALSKLPQTFGYKELHKGFFPHLWNTKQNQEYEGPFPDAKYYPPDSMSPEKRQQFYEWYEGEKGKHFVLQDELLKYCISDVQILRRCCLQFRTLFKKVSSQGENDEGIDPFQNCITIASACNLVYRRNFLSADTIAVLPPTGYECKEQQSKVALQWLHYVHLTEGKYIQHARNKGEKQIGKYKVDGYDAESQTIYSFNGCYFHGCVKCYPNKKTINNTMMTPMSELDTRTLERKTFLESTCTKFVEMWECEWKAIVKNLPEDIKVTLQHKSITGPRETLNPRHGFYGERTNASCLFHKTKGDDVIRYLDFCSLCSFINKYCSYPLYHPEIITENFKNVSDYYDLIKCQEVTPPKLFHPLLPYRSGGKLTFPLCRSCVDTLQQSLCTHTDDERALHVTWVSIELEKAIELGYRVIDIEVVWHFEHSEQYDRRVVYSRSILTLFLSLKLKLLGGHHGSSANKTRHNI